MSPTAHQMGHAARQQVGCLLCNAAHRYVHGAASAVEHGEGVADHERSIFGLEMPAASGSRTNSRTLPILGLRHMPLAASVPVGQISQSTFVIWKIMWQPLP